MSWELARAPVRVYAGPTPERIDRSAPVAVLPTGTEVTIALPDPGVRRYFEVVAAGSRHGPIVSDRFLRLDGAPNSRDLGGYQTGDGRRTRWGRLFRSDGLGELTDPDRVRLARLGLPTTCTDGGAQPATPAALEAAAAAVTTAAARRRDRHLLLRLADGPDAQWVQCTRFDDRLGWSAALVLTTLGVRKETVVADHLLGTPLAAAPAPDRRPLDLAFAAVGDRYGSWERYLGRGLGLDPRTRARLHARYVTDR